MEANLIAREESNLPPQPKRNFTAKSAVRIRRYKGDPANLDLGCEMPPRLEEILTTFRAGCVYMNPKVAVHAAAWTAEFFREASLAHRAWNGWMRDAKLPCKRSCRRADKRTSFGNHFWLRGILWIEQFEPVSILDTPVPEGIRVEVHPVPWDRVKRGEFAVPLAQYRGRLRRLRDTEKPDCCFATPGFTAVADQAASEFFAGLESWKKFWRKRCHWHLKKQFGLLKRAADPQTRRLFFDEVVIVEPDSIPLGTTIRDHLTRVKALAHAQLGGWNQVREFLDSADAAKSNQAMSTT